MRKTWGRTKPVAVLGQRISYDGDISSIPFLLTDVADITTLESMMENQATSILVLRFNDDPRVYFVVVSDIAEVKILGTYTYQVKFAETYANEAV